MSFLSLTTSLFIQNDPMAGLGNRFAIIIIGIISALFSRFILIKFMNRWMMSKSKKTKTKIIISEEDELKVTKNLKFKMLDLDSDFSAATESRQTMVTRAKKSMLNQFKIDLLVVLVYVLIGLYLEFIALESSYIYFLYIVLFLIWTVMRYIGYRHQFTAYQKGVFRVIAPLWKFVFAVFQARWYMLLALVVLVITLFNSSILLSIGVYDEGFVMLFGAIFHVFMILRVRKKARQRDNLKLLILRVFLINKTSLFTFSKLAKFWKHFGSYFTVSDPSFYRTYWKGKFRNKFPVFIIMLFLVYTQIENSSETSPFAPFVALLIFGAIIFVIYSIGRMKLNFISNETALDKDLKQLDKWPVKLDNTFKEKPMSCYDNTWMMTVNKLVNTVDVVLMDLRGFSEKNKGCEFEVNLLLNTIKLEKILFIGYPDAIPLIKSVIEKKFQTLDQDSPNIGVSLSVATLFTVNKENTKETQHIMDVLIYKALH